MKSAIGLPESRAALPNDMPPSLYSAAAKAKRTPGSASNESSLRCTAPRKAKDAHRPVRHDQAGRWRDRQRASGGAKRGSSAGSVTINGNVARLRILEDLLEGR